MFEPGQYVTLSPWRSPTGYLDYSYTDEALRVDSVTATHILLTRPGARMFARQTLLVPVGKYTLSLATPEMVCALWDDAAADAYAARLDGRAELAAQLEDIAGLE